MEHAERQSLKELADNVLERVGRSGTEDGTGEEQHPSPSQRVGCSVPLSLYRGGTRGTMEHACSPEQLEAFHRELLAEPTTYRRATPAEQCTRCRELVGQGVRVLACSECDVPETPA